MKLKIENTPREKRHIFRDDSETNSRVVEPFSADAVQDRDTKR